MGNIHYESAGFQPDIVEGGTGIGYGLIQWSFGRRDQLEAYAASKGKEPSDVSIQIEYLLGELTPGGGADGYADYNFNSSGDYIKENWENATTIEESTRVFCKGFERPQDPEASLSDRITYAKEYYELYHK